MAPSPGPSNIVFFTSFFCSLASLFLRNTQAECSRYFGDDLLRPVAYAGSPKARGRLAGRLGLGPAGNGKDRNGTNGGADGSQGPGADGATASAAEEEEEPERANVVITSYNVLRADADVLGKQVQRFLPCDNAGCCFHPGTGNTTWNGLVNGVEQ